MNEKNFKELLKQLNIGQNKSSVEIKELLESKLSEYLDRQDEEAEEIVSDIQDALDYVEELIAKMGGGITIYSEETEEEEKINKELLEGAASKKKKSAEEYSESSNGGSNNQPNQTPGVNPKGKAWFYSVNGDKKIDDMFELAEGDLKMEDYSHALTVFDTILSIEMTNAGAYMGKVLATYKLKEPKDIATCLQDGIEQDNNLKRVEQCGSEQQKKFVQDALDERRKYMVYIEAEKILGNNQSDTVLLEKAAKKFESLGAYRDASQKANKCKEKGYEIVYQNASKVLMQGSNPTQLLIAEEMFKRIVGYKDAVDKANNCHKVIEDIKMQLIIRERIRNARFNKWKNNV